MRFWLRLPRSALLLAALAGVAGCARRGAVPDEAGRPVPARVEAAGLHNVYRLGDNLYSGSGPESDTAFASLKKLGIKTVISVDGAKPDLARARKQGLRYVHLPAGYGGISRAQALRIARAVRDLPGPVYIHCHHGKHRGPAAVAVALVCLDDSFGTEDADAWLRLAGTDPGYKGLYAAPRDLRRPTKEELDAVPADFPEAVAPGGMVKLMVAVDERFDNLKLARKSGWKTPPRHADIDPPHEALQLAELYREAARLSALKARGHERLRRWLGAAEAGAKRLEVSLRKSDRAGAEKAFKAVGGDCKRCHNAFRDAPPRR